jgi:hypothetical protein
MEFFTLAGPATALFAILTLSFRVMNRVMLSITRGAKRNIAVWSSELNLNVIRVMESAALDPDWLPG